MTIEQERDIAVRALELIANGYGLRMKPLAKDTLAAIKREQALQALVDQAQDLDMGYGAMQASPVAWRMFSDLNWHFNSEKPLEKFLHMWQPLYTAPPVAKDQDAARYRWLRENRDIP